MNNTPGNAPEQKDDVAQKMCDGMNYDAGIRLLYEGKTLTPEQNVVLQTLSKKYGTDIEKDVKDFKYD